MLTRKVSTDENPSTFEWDGMNMVREVDAVGNVTQYFVIRGVIRSFLRGGVTYQVHSSVQGHVRLITDASGVVVFNAYAWGNTLDVTDNVPDGGWMYRYVGARGCRFDAATEMTYMRARWYSLSMQRFLSRDVLRAVNRYQYAKNDSPSQIDPMGTDPIGMTPQGAGTSASTTGQQSQAQTGPTSTGYPMLDLFRAAADTPINDALLNYAGGNDYTAQHFWYDTHAQSFAFGQEGRLQFGGLWRD